MRNGFIMAEWVVAVALTALLLTGAAPLIGQGLRALGEMQGRLYCARESMQISGIVDSYLYSATVTDAPGNRRTLSFVSEQRLDHRWVAQPQQLYLELSDGQWQPLTAIGRGTALAPRWMAGDGGREMFTVADGGQVEYTYHWEYDSRRRVMHGAICPLATSYAVGRVYAFR